MNVLLVSQHGIGFWFALRLLKEGHSVEIWLTKRGPWEKTLEGLVPAPYLRRPPESVLRAADLILFDQNGTGKLAEDLSQYAPVLGDSLFASKMEDDRLFGIEVMEARWVFVTDGLALRVITKEIVSSANAAASAHARRPIPK